MVQAGEDGMTALKLVDLNEETCPINETELHRIRSGEPKDAVAVAASLPREKRAQLSRFCYERVHLHELGLRIAATCELPELEQAFGHAAKTVFAQSRDLDSILERRSAGNGASISLPTVNCLR